MTKVMTCMLSVAGLSLVAGPLFAHHGRGTTYDLTQQVTLEGTITEVSWRNPHIAIFMDVRDGNGDVVEWIYRTQQHHHAGQARLWPDDADSW